MSYNTHDNKNQYTPVTELLHQKLINTELALINNPLKTNLLIKQKVNIKEALMLLNMAQTISLTPIDLQQLLVDDPHNATRQIQEQFTLHNEEVTTSTNTFANTVQAKYYENELNPEMLVQAVKNAPTIAVKNALQKQVNPTIQRLLMGGVLTAGMTYGIPTAVTLTSLATVPLVLAILTLASTILMIPTLIPTVIGVAMGLIVIKSLIKTVQL